MIMRIVEKDAPTQKVLKFELPPIVQGVPEVAIELLERSRKNQNEFKLADTARVQTGLDKIEERTIEEEVDAKVLEKLKSVQEPAYQEAYQLGLMEGRKEAFAASASEIQERLGQLDGLVANIKNLKTELVQNNETHLIKLLLHMASRVAQHEVSVNQQSLVAVMKSAIESSQSDEAITVRLGTMHLSFFEELKKSSEYNLDFLKNVKFVPDEKMSPGGCVIETNYGEVDARIEERIQKLWTSFEESLFQVKDNVSAA